ncbi:MAG: methylated-DNA--[protein]-cysteine S-methyltransferase [Thermoplasmata archaeon]|nr:methylated-DNA--[protein]-cysteine S-methyltransferase [Thermoplasmata archaeon]MCI4354062.1 methylated-DNA--[protein]-cysteine S-methyltransferase [Thermoplasmata archaeon]
MAPPKEVAEVPTPIGTFRVVYEGQSVQAVDLLERGLTVSAPPADARRRRAPFPKGSPPKQLQEYFQGRRTQFEVSVDLAVSSPFDHSVYEALQRVAPGEVVTYGELARRSGHAGAARAVGGSMHRNPIPIVVPCHRVVGENGSLTGFGLGLWRKRWLLDHEDAWPIRSKSAEGPRGKSQRTLDQMDPPQGVPAPARRRT